MIPKEMKYNLHYDDVRVDVLPPPHGTNTNVWLNGSVQILEQVWRLFEENSSAYVFYQSDVWVSQTHKVNCIKVILLSV